LEFRRVLFRSSRRAQLARPAGVVETAPIRAVASLSHPPNPWAGPAARQSDEQVADYRMSTRSHVHTFTRSRAHGFTQNYRQRAMRPLDRVVINNYILANASKSPT